MAWIILLSLVPCLPLPRTKASSISTTIYKDHEIERCPQISLTISPNPNMISVRWQNKHYKLSLPLPFTVLNLFDLSSNPYKLITTLRKWEGKRSLLFSTDYSLLFLAQLCSLGGLVPLLLPLHTLHQCIRSLLQFNTNCWSSYIPCYNQ